MRTIIPPFVDEERKVPTETVWITCHLNWQNPPLYTGLLSQVDEFIEMKRPFNRTTPNWDLILRGDL